MKIIEVKEGDCVPPGAVLRGEFEREEQVAEESEWYLDDWRKKPVFKTVRYQSYEIRTEGPKEIHGFLNDSGYIR